MEYVPPSDPEDNDFDYDEFELYRTNQPQQIFDFSDDDHENVWYATLEAHNTSCSPTHMNPALSLIQANSPPNVNQSPSPDGAAPLSPPSQGTVVPDSDEDEWTPLSPMVLDDSPVHSESENEDSYVDPLDNDDDFGIPLEWPPSHPMVNYSGDIEIEEDYKIGWEWLECDTGPIIGPYSGFWQCLVDPAKTKPEDFFNAIFDECMFTTMAEMMNLYAHNRLQSK